MKTKFSTSWKASSQPRKQRKYSANAPIHLKRKLLSVNIAKDLRKKHGKKSIVVRKGDTVKIMRGKFKKKKGKILEVKTKSEKIYIEGMQVKKMDGSKVNVPFKASNLQIVELNLEDRKRKINHAGKETKKQEPVKKKSDTQPKTDKEIKENAPKKTKNT